jgi:hypothetical protein
MRATNDRIFIIIWLIVCITVVIFAGLAAG